MPDQPSNPELRAIQEASVEKPDAGLEVEGSADREKPKQEWKLVVHRVGDIKDVEFVPAGSDNTRTAEEFEYWRNRLDKLIGRSGNVQDVEGIPTEYRAPVLAAIVEQYRQAGYDVVANFLDGLSNREKINVLREIAVNFDPRISLNIYNPGIPHDFSQEEQQELIQIYLNNGLDNVAGLIEVFSTLPKSVAQLAVEKGEGYLFIENRDKFSGVRLDVKAAEKMIKYGQGRYVLEAPELFEGLEVNADLIERIESVNPGSAIEHWGKVEGLDIDKFAERLIDVKGDPEDSPEDIDRYSGSRKRVSGKAKLSRYLSTRGPASKGEVGFVLGNGVAEKLIKKGAVREVFLYPEVFPDFKVDQRVAEMIVDAGGIGHLSSRLEGLDKNALLVREVGRTTHGDFLTHAAKSSEWTPFSREVADALLKKDWKFAYFLAKHLGSFEPLDRSVAVRIFEKGQYHHILNKLDKFESGELNAVDQQVWDFYTDPTVPPHIKKATETAEGIGAARTVFEGDGFLSEEKRVALPSDFVSRMLRARVKYRVAPSVAVRLSDDGKFDYLEEDWFQKELVEEIRSSVRDESIQEAIVEAGATCGSGALLDYLNRPDLSVHDALHFWDQLVRVIEKNRLDDHVFASTVLKQVAQDNASYPEGTAHHKFAAVVDGLAPGADSSQESGALLTAILDQAREFPNVKKLQDLVAEFEQGGGSPFESWKRFKKLGEINQLLGQSEILSELEEGEMSPELRVFVEKLAFHPNIAMQAVLDFWRRPAFFLGIDDEHTEDRMNAAKKPSNYLSLPYLGLRAEDLRDAYVEGTIDRLQILPPMEVTNDPQALHGYLRRAVGQRREGVAPEAQSGRKTFTAVQEFCRAHDIGFKELWDPVTGPEVVGELNETLQADLREIVFKQGQGMKPPEDVFRVKLGRKSDPDMVVAGNDTASCMPFGSGKNNVYMFNPNCAQLVVQRRMSDGSWRTAAQSVMTVDLETTHATEELMKAYLADQGSLKDMLSEEDLLGRFVLTCDNIEVAKNEEGSRSEQIRAAYEDFLKRYLAKHAEDLGLDASRVAVGQGYTPESLGLDSVSNTFVPLAPMGYSDNTGKDAYLIRTGLEAGKAGMGKRGVTPLRTQDTIAVAVLEGKAYRDNQSVLEYVHGMQNNIIGMRIANEFYNRPNLSFLYRDDNGIPKGYMLAYEGRNGDLHEVYIADIAADPGSKLAGGTLMREFFQMYRSHYGSEDRPFLPITANMRSQTSFRIARRQLERLATKAGLVAEMEVVSEYEHGGDTFYNVRMYVEEDRERLEEQKKRYAGLDLDEGGEYFSDEEGGGYVPYTDEDFEPGGGYDEDDEDEVPHDPDYDW